MNKTIDVWHVMLDKNQQVQCHVGVVRDGALVHMWENITKELR